MHEMVPDRETESWSSDEEGTEYPFRLLQAIKTPPELLARAPNTVKAPDTVRATQTSTPELTEFTIGWICALSFEKSAAEVMLDKKYPSPPRVKNSSVLFTLGCVGPHKVVVACLPKGQPGLSSAAVVAREMLSTFPRIEFGFMVGIGGGVPSDEHDIRLGDVVVSQPHDKHGGVVQYDMGKSEESGWRPTGHLAGPPSYLLSVLGQVQTNHDQNERTYPLHMARFDVDNRTMEAFTQPRGKRDLLFLGNYPHVQGKSDCRHCDPHQTVQRSERDIRDAIVKIHHGTIASGNRVIKSAHQRDNIVEKLGGNILCFEMEAAGLMNNFPCLVIRGISDYCDSHKHDAWQRYAAGNAAAFTRELLLLIPPEDTVK
jgi:nucleoside phosphorylase